MSLEEMACAFDDFKACVRFCRKTIDERAQSICSPELVAVAVYEENRLAAAFEKSEIVFINGRAETDEPHDSRVSDADFKPDTRAE
jgi:hypothetical protein